MSNRPKHLSYEKQVVIIEEDGNNHVAEFMPLDRQEMSYEEARHGMGRMLGNFGYGLTKETLRGFMDELANYFCDPSSNITEAEFAAAALLGWRYVQEPEDEDE